MLPVTFSFFVFSLMLFLFFLSFVRTRYWYEHYRRFLILLFVLILYPYLFFQWKQSGQLSFFVFSQIALFIFDAVIVFLFFQETKSNRIFLLSFPLFSALIAIFFRFPLAFFHIVFLSFSGMFLMFLLRDQNLVLNRIGFLIFLLIAEISFGFFTPINIQSFFILLFYIATSLLFLLRLKEIKNKDFLPSQDVLKLFSFIFLFPLLLILSFLPVFLHFAQDTMVYRLHVFIFLSFYTFFVILEFQGRVKVENFRQFAESFFRIFEKSKEGVFLLKNWKIIRSNKAASDLFAYTPEEFLGIHISDLFEENLRYEANSDFLHQEMIAREKEGNVFESLVSVVSLREEENLQLMIIRDIRKYAEEIRNVQTLNEIFRLLIFQKRGREEKFSSLVRLIRDAYHCQSVFIYDKFGEFFGTQEAKSGFRQKVQEFYKKKSQGMEIQKLFGKDYLFIPIRNGQNFYGILVLESDSHKKNEQTYLNLSADMIAQYFENEELLFRLEQSNRKYRTVLESSLSGIFLIQDGVFRYVNRMFANLVAYSLAELMEMKKPLYLVREEYREVIFYHIRQLMSGKVDEVTASIKLYKKDGTQIWGKYHGVLIDLDGRSAILGYLMDITKELELEKQEEKVMRMMMNEQKMKTFKHLVSGISHEFNNIFTIIKGTVELMRYKTDKEDPLFDSLKEISGAVDRGSKITNRMRVFLRHEKMDIRILFLEEFFEHSFSLFRSIVNKSGKKIKISYQVDPATPYVMADEFSMEEIFINLIQNSVEAISERGEIKIRVWMRKTGLIEIEVVDNGSGISKDVLLNVFEPFFTTKDRNRGLGLFIVYQLMESMNGSIQIDSLPKQGTRISLLFPAYSNSETLHGKLL